MVKEKRGVRFNFQSVKLNNKNYFYKKRVAVMQSFFSLASLWLDY